jgi:hypothetical protein
MVLIKRLQRQGGLLTCISTGYIIKGKITGALTVKKKPSVPENLVISCFPSEGEQ